MPEIWKPVNGYEGIYEVSNAGRVKSLPRERLYGKPNSKKVTTKEFIRKPTLRNGYLAVSLSKDGAKETKSIHRIVAEAFIENPENKLQINHIDGIKTNNNLENLEWCTSKENIRHAFNNNLSRARKGEENNLAKLKRDQIKEIRELYKTGRFTKTAIAEIFRITDSNVNLIVNNRTWKEEEQP